MNRGFSLSRFVHVKRKFLKGAGTVFCSKRKNTNTEEKHEKERFIKT